MTTILVLLLLAQAPDPSGHELGEELIKGAAGIKIIESKLYLRPEVKPFAPLESIISQERYIFDDKLYATIDNLNTPILYLHSEYLRIPLVTRLMYGSIALFIPRFEKTVSSWELVLTDSRGEAVRRYAERGLPPTSIAWDGRRDNGEMCNMGEVYNYVFNAFDAVGNPTRISGRSYKFNGIVYTEKGSRIVALASQTLFAEGGSAIAAGAKDYLDEVCNIVKDNFKKEVVVYSYSESEHLAMQRAEAVMAEVIRRAVLPPAAVLTSPRFIPGLLPKYSKIEIVIH